MNHEYVLAVQTIASVVFGLVMGAFYTLAATKTIRTIGKRSMDEGWDNVLIQQERDHRRADADLRNDLLYDEAETKEQIKDLEAERATARRLKDVQTEAEFWSDMEDDDDEYDDSLDGTEIKIVSDNGCCNVDGRV